MVVRYALIRSIMDRCFRSNAMLPPGPATESCGFVVGTIGGGSGGTLSASGGRGASVADGDPAFDCGAGWATGTDCAAAHAVIAAMPSRIAPAMAAGVALRIRSSELGPGRRSHRTVGPRQNVVLSTASRRQENRKNAPRNALLAIGCGDFATRHSIPLVLAAANQDFPLARMIRRGHDAFLFHALHDRGGAIVADLQPALDVARRRLAVAQHDLHRLLVEVGGFTGGTHRGGVEHRAVLALRAEIRRDGLEILRRSLGLQVAHYLLDLLVGHEGAMHAADAATTRHVQHVRLAEQLFGALLAQNGSAVDLRGDLKRNTCRKIRLDGAGDDIDRRALRRQDHVDTGRARHLGEALDGAFA